MEEVKLNANPTIHRKSEHVQEAAIRRIISDLDYICEEEENQPASHSEHEPLDAGEVFDQVRDIKDPEHPLSLEELNVVQESAICVDNDNSTVTLFFTPTVPHCSMSTLIGLCLRVRLMRALPVRFKVDIFVEPGSHVSELQVNKQLNDKERVAAALENAHLIQVVNKCLST